MNVLLRAGRSDSARRRHEGSNDIYPTYEQINNHDIVDPPSFIDTPNVFQRKFGRQYIQRDSSDNRNKQKENSQVVIDLRSMKNNNIEDMSVDRVVEVFQQDQTKKKESNGGFTLFSFSKQQQRINSFPQNSMKSPRRLNKVTDKSSIRPIRPLILEGNQSNQIRSTSMSLSEELISNSAMKIPTKQPQNTLQSSITNKTKMQVPVLQYAFLRQEGALSMILPKQQQNLIFVPSSQMSPKASLNEDFTKKSQEQQTSSIFSRPTLAIRASSFKFNSKMEDERISQKFQNKEIMLPSQGNRNICTSGNQAIFNGMARQSTAYTQVKCSNINQEASLQVQSSEKKSSSKQQIYNFKLTKSNNTQTSSKKKLKKKQMPQKTVEEGQQNKFEQSKQEDKNGQCSPFSQSEEIENYQLVSQIEDMNDFCDEKNTINNTEDQNIFQGRLTPQKSSIFCKDNLSNYSESIGKQLRMPSQDNTEAEEFLINSYEIAPLNLSAKSFCIFDVDKNKPILAVKSKKSREIASLTKIMTCYVICQAILKKKIQQSDTVRVSKTAASMIGTSAHLRSGDKLSVWDLLYGLMLPSGNDAAFALAEHYGRVLYFENDETRKQQLEANPNSFENCKTRDAIKSFIQEMNKESKELGLNSTHYSNPHGLVNRANRSSAFDICKLSAHCLNNLPIFRQIVKTKQYTCQIKTKQGLVRLGTWENTNKCLLRYNSVCEGLKTGVTCTAGPCLTTTWKVGGRQFIITVLKCDTLEQRYSESHRLFAWLCQKFDIQISPQERMPYEQVKQLFKKQSSESLSLKETANSIVNTSYKNTQSNSSLQATELLSGIVSSYEMPQYQSSKFVPDQSQDKTTSSSISN